MLGHCRHPAQVVHLLAVDQEVADDRPMAALRVLRVVRSLRMDDLAAWKPRRETAAQRPRGSAEDGASTMARSWGGPAARRECVVVVVTGPSGGRFAEAGARPGGRGGWHVQLVRSRLG